MESKREKYRRRTDVSGARREIGVCLASWQGVRGSKVRTADHPTGSPQAAGGAPPRVSPRPWCRPGRILGPRPAWGRSCAEHAQFCTSLGLYVMQQARVVVFALIDYISSM